MATEKRSPEHRYGIGAVAKLTGLSDHTIRVWERRYGTVVARRAANGRRLYSAADVEKLGLLKRLTDQGLSIGQIASSSIESLRERAGELQAMSQAPEAAALRVAVLGDFLPAQLRAHEAELEPLVMLIVDSSPERFDAELAIHAVDVVVLECATLDHDTPRKLRAYVHRAGARAGVIVYRFARYDHVERASAAGTVMVRAPVHVDEIRSAVLSAGQGPRRSPPVATPQTVESPADWDFAGAVSPPRFSQQQLAALSVASSNIECECPHHLAQLVGDLGAFEVYSAQCANRSDEDAALHAYLHRITAQARALIETALDRLVRVEGIEV